LFTRLPSAIKDTATGTRALFFRPFLFNVGINHEAFFAQKWGENNVEIHLNRIGLRHISE
jgi:hypothetical protein